MTSSTRKDFAPIQVDYLFFQDHSTEADEDLRGYLAEFAGRLNRDEPLNILDFGCGSGRFTQQFLDRAGVPPRRLRLALVEPVADYREEAVTRLQPYAAEPVTAAARLSDECRANHDLILANHVLYYVPDLDAALDGLLRVLRPDGLLLTAMAGRDNPLVRFWMACFERIRQPLPWYVADDLEDRLRKRSVNYRKREVVYKVEFPDSEDNRLKIMRFLLGQFFAATPRRFMLELFDPHAGSGRVVMRARHDHYLIRDQAGQTRHVVLRPS